MAKEVNDLILKDSRQLHNNIIVHNLLSQKSEESLESYWSKPVTCRNNEGSQGFQVNEENKRHTEMMSSTKRDFMDPKKHYDELKEFASRLKDEEVRDQEADINDFLKEDVNPNYFNEMDKTNENNSDEGESQNDSEDPDRPEEDGDEVPINDEDTQPRRIGKNRLRDFNKVMSESAKFTTKSKKSVSKYTSQKLGSKVASIMKTEASKEEIESMVDF